MRWGLGVLLLASSVGLGAQPQAEVNALAVDGLSLADNQWVDVHWENLGSGSWKLKAVSGNGPLELNVRGFEAANLGPQRATKVQARVMLLPDGPTRALEFFDAENVLVGQMGLGVRAKGAALGPAQLVAQGGSLVLKEGDQPVRTVPIGVPLPFVRDGQRWQLVLSQLRVRSEQGKTDEPALAFDYWAWRLP